MPRPSLVPKRLSIGLMTLKKVNYGENNRPGLKYVVNLGVYSLTNKSFAVPMPRIHNRKHSLNTIRQTRKEVIHYIEQHYIELLRQQAEIPEYITEHIQENLCLTPGVHLISHCIVYPRYLKVTYIDTVNAIRKSVTLNKTKIPGQIDFMTIGNAIMIARTHGIELDREDFRLFDTTQKTYVLDESHIAYFSDCKFIM